MVSRELHSAVGGVCLAAAAAVDGREEQRGEGTDALLFTCELVSHLHYTRPQREREGDGGDSFRDL